MDPPQRLASDEALQRLVTEGEFAKARLRCRQTTLAQPEEILGGVILGPIDDAQIFAAAHFQRRLNETFFPRATKSRGLITIPSPPSPGQSLPPCDRIDRRRARHKCDRGPMCPRTPVGRPSTIGPAHVPDVILIEPDLPLAGEQMEGRDLEVADPDTGQT